MTNEGKSHQTGDESAAEYRGSPKFGGGRWEVVEVWVVVAMLMVAVVLILAVVGGGTPVGETPVVEETQAPMSFAQIAGVEPTPDPEEIDMTSVILRALAPEGVYLISARNGACAVELEDGSPFLMANADADMVEDESGAYEFGCLDGEFYLVAAETEGLAGLATENEAEATSVPTTTPASTGVPGQQVAEGITVSGFPEVSVPVRWGNGVFQSNTNPTDSIAWMVAEPGVLSADDIEHCEGNVSCVWSGGASVDNLMENTTGSYSCPEGGYVKVTYPQGTITIGELSVSVDGVADTGYTTLIRCPYAENTAGDDSIRIDFTIDHDYAGNMKVMRYPVPLGAGGFFSIFHLEEDLNNALGISDRYDRDAADNCGEDGCANAKVILVDVNHSSLGVYDYSGPSQWQKLYQNVVRPTPAQ